MSSQTAGTELSRRRGRTRAKERVGELLDQQEALRELGAQFSPNACKALATLF